MDYLCQLIYKKITGHRIMYESENESDVEEAECDLGEFQDDSQRPDYSIGVILTYKAQVDLVNQLIAESNNDAFKQIQVSTVDAF